jgi:hypothetical protein
MRTARNDPDVTTGSERRRIIWILLISFSLPVVAMLISQAGQPQLALVVLRRASSFSWCVTGLALTAALLWMYARHGVIASEPYGYLLTIWLVSYVGAALWRRWRGF